MSDINEFPIKTRVFTVDQFKGDKGDFGQLQSVTIDGDDFVFTDNNGNTARLVDAVPQLRIEASDLRHDELTNRDLANQHPISAIENLQEFLDGKVDAVIGKQLSDENYTLAEKTRLANIDDELNAKVDNDDSRLTDAREWIADEVSLEEAQARTSGTFKKWSALRVGQAIVAWWQDTGNQETLDDLISSGDLADALAGKVDKVAGFGLSQANFTQAEKDKLANLEDSKFKGLYEDLSALQAAYPTADAGSYAFIDGTEGNPNQLYVWATDSWEIVGGEVVSLTPAQVKQLLLENADTNNFSDSDKQKLQDAVTQTELASALTGYAQVAHNHTIAQVTGLQGELDSKAASDHGHAISDVSGLQSALDNKASSSHTHAISQVTGLNDALSTKVDKVSGKGLSTNDYDNTAKSKVDEMGTAASRDVTTSTTDTTAGRVTKVGDGGLLRVALEERSLETRQPASIFRNDDRTNNARYGQQVSVLNMPYVAGRSVEFAAAISSNQAWVSLQRSTDNWRTYELYHTGNAVGTVSHSGGVPTGAIIQRGSNASGEFVRFADGTQICWRTILVGSPIATGSGTFEDPYAANSFGWSFPAGYITAPAVSAIGDRGSISTDPTRNRFAVSASLITENSVNRIEMVRIGNSTSVSGEENVKLMAIGRWY